MCITKLGPQWAAARQPMPRSSARALDARQSAPCDLPLAAARSPLSDPRPSAGQLGNGDTLVAQQQPGKSQSVPVPVKTPLLFTDIQASAYFTCASTSNFKIYCWGDVSAATAPQCTSRRAATGPAEQSRCGCGCG